MDHGRFGNEDNGRFGNKDVGFGNEYNGGIGNEEYNDRDVLNENLFEQMRLDDAGGEDDDEVSVGVGSGGGGVGEDEAEAVANEAGVVVDAAVMDNEAVGPPLLPDELVDATIVFPADDHGDDDVPDALSIPHGLLLGSDLINAPVAESTRRQYNHANADFMMYLWDDRSELLSIPAMELLNRAWVSVQHSCFKSSEA
jgi:hypothetical protein